MIRSAAGNPAGGWQKNRDDPSHSARRAGWRVLVLWECQTAAAKLGRVGKRVERFLKGTERQP